MSLCTLHYCNKPALNLSILESWGSFIFRFFTKENLETYKQLRSILAEWLDSKEYLTKEEFEHYASENLTADIRNEVAVRVQVI